MKTVMACIDFSDTSGPVLDETGRLAEALHARIVLLHVDPIETQLAMADAGFIGTLPAAKLEERPAAAELQRRAQRVAEPGRVVETIHVEGLVIDQIIEQAEHVGADVLVMGSHGHGALYHLLMGSITEGVLRKIKRPVLVVPAPEAA